MKRHSSLNYSCKVAAAPLLLSAALAYAGPEGGQVILGAGTIAQSGATTTIDQSTQNLTLDWQTFDIAAHETVNFVQPSASAIAVNRIFDTNGTQILGRLSANGQVFLINPSGILFGHNAQVNVGGLVAATLDITAGGGDSKRFAGDGAGSVVNRGTINAAEGGYIALLGNQVSNQGQLTAPFGSVALGAGNDVTLTFDNNSLVAMQVDSSVLNSLANNGGLIRAAGGTVVMNAGAKDALLASVVNNTGVIEAHTVENRNGTIVLLGGMEAGTVNVGGTLDAGAPHGGNAGFIETSAAHVQIAPTALVTTAAPRGATGQWLIDPSDFTIAASGGDMTGAFLSNALGLTDVVIESGAGATGFYGDILVNDSVTWSANRLTLDAYRNIDIAAPLHASGTASLAFEYGQRTLAANRGGIVNVHAPVNLATGTAFSTTLGSDGAVVNYAVINDIAALQGVSADLAGRYVLGSDIDASVTSTWNSGAGFIPLGDNATRFTGVFDGLGHSIANLTIDRPSTDFVGLFGNVQAPQIHNVGLVDANVRGRNYVGGLMGATVLGAGTYNYVTGQVNGQNSVGGLIGYNNTTVISSSYSASTVTGANKVGGLMGETNGGVPASSNYASGNVTGSGNAVGGLVGYNGFAFLIVDSYASGNVTGATDVGGLAGYHLNGEIRNVYSIGSVAGTSAVGGLVGRVGTGTVTRGFWDSTTSGQAISAGGTALTSAQMQQEANFAGLDFYSTWIAYDGFTHPLLRSFMTPLTVTTNAAKVYDGVAYSGGNGATYSSTPNGNLLGTLSYGGNAQGAIDAGSYTLSGTGLYSGQHGYAVSYVGELRVTPAALTLGSSAVTKIYDGDVTALGTATVVSGTLFGSATLGDGVFEFTDRNVGAGDKVVTTFWVAINDGNGGGNYDVSYVDNTASTITAANLTLSTLDVSKTYDGGLSAAGSAVVAGGTLFGSDALDGGTFAFTNKNAGAGNKIVTTAGVTVNDNNGGGNYNVSYADNTASTISAANLTLSTVSVSKVYDGGLSAAGSAVVTGGTLFGGDTLDGGTFAFADKNVGAGNKIVTATGVTVADGNGGGNYNVSYADSTTSTISAAALAVTGVTADDKVFDGTTMATLRGAAAVTALGADDVTVTGAGSGAFADADVGAAKAVAVDGFSLSGTDARNYVVMQPTGLSASITPFVVEVIPPVVPPVIPPVSTRSPIRLAVVNAMGQVASTVLARQASARRVVRNLSLINAAPPFTLQIVDGGVNLPDSAVNSDE